MPSPLFIHIHLSSQTLSLWKNGALQMAWSISSAKNGPGEDKDSGCTPRGWHRVRAMIGHDAPLDAVFVGRRPTGERWTPALASAFPHRDWILSRILWLCGCEPGKNRGGAKDTQRRYIYIHGTPSDQPMGKPLSHGCIRMRSKDIITLFDHLQPGCPVLIELGFL
jgi:L,D-transpeptidase YbiS